MVKRSATSAERIGISLSPHSLCAVIARSDRAQPRIWRTALADFATDGAAAWPSLATALQSLARELPSAGGELCVALHAPLAELRVADLPSLRDVDLQQLLARNAGKYFVSARGSQVIGLVPAARDATHRIVAAAAGKLLDAIHDAAHAAGFRVASIVPAEAAWVASAEQWNESSGSSARVMIVSDNQTLLLGSARSQLTDVRRFRAGTGDVEDIATACAGDSVRTVMVGDASIADALSRQLAPRGVVLHVPSAIPAELIGAPDALAARFAPAVRTPVFVTESVKRERTAQAGRLARRLGIAAVVLLLLSAVLQLWGVRRELVAVRAERDAIRPQLSATLVGRTTVETAFRQLALLAETERSAPLWSRVIGGISEQLPYEAYLTGFRGRADTVGVDGLAQQAARVFDAIEAVPQLRGVHASSPVRRETSADGEALERFQLSALLRPPPADSAGGQP